MPTDAKKDILNTCLKYFLQHGIRKMSNDKLVALLGISTKTIYKHFKNKEKLLEDVLHLYHDQKYEMLQNLPADQNSVSILLDVWRVAIETEPGLVLEGIYALYVSLVREQQYKNISASIFEIIQNTMAVYFRGFCSDKGTKILDKHINQFNTTQKSTNSKNIDPTIKMQKIDK